MKYYVDIPSIAAIEDPNSSWVNIGEFDSKEEALRFVQDHFGADGEGNVCLIG